MFVIEQKRAYEIRLSLVGSEICRRGRERYCDVRVTGEKEQVMSGRRKGRVERAEGGMRNKRSTGR